MRDKDLIAEARSCAGFCSQDVREAMRDTGEIVTRLADALAAIERVKRLLAPMRNRLEEYGETPLRYTVGKTLEILAALDGAPEPEPEWEYGFELIEPDDRNVFDREGDFVSAKFAYRAAKKRLDAEHQADLPRLQYAIVRRRKAGPWLPVEGESK